MDAGYSVRPETIAAMLDYCNVTPEIVELLGAAIMELINTYEECFKGLVEAHRKEYAALLAECKSLILLIAGDVESAAVDTRKKALTYERVLSKKIR